MDANFVGQEIQGYRIMKPIGQGKFSTVYKAENSEGQPVAVKKIKIFDMMDPKQREKCLKQVDLMKPLSHPNIIKYIDSFTHNNELIIVTEWAEKGDLKRLIKEHQADETPFEEIRIWEFLIQISSALNHMHEKRIMHRDLKPANIFIAQDDTLKVGDLGLGRAFGSQTIEAHSKVGTPLYMSPELLRDEGYQANADVWSLGCIAYEFAQLRSPFRNENQKMSLMDLFNNITRGQYKPISNRYSPELADLIKRMIVVDPNRRLSSGEVLQIADENFSRLKKSPKIDCFIVMEDIITKLHLIDYQVFCKVAERKPINRFYFALQDTQCEANDQLYHFLQMGYWLMNLSKVDRSKQKAAAQAKAMIDWKSVEGACNKFLSDVLVFGIKHQLPSKSILQGYGQGVCHLLNQLLNRQLIRLNFKFQLSEQPAAGGRSAVEEEYQEMEVDEDLLVKHTVQPDDDIEETLEFQRSVLFKRGKKLQYDNADKYSKDRCRLLQKIKEIDEDDTNMIVGKVQEKQWELECVRVEKQLAAITTGLKENRRKNGSYDNFQRIKHSSNRIRDVIGYVKPSSYKLYEETLKDCQRIARGEKLINGSLGDMRSEYGEKNKQRTFLVEQLGRFTTAANERVRQLQQLQSKLQSINGMISNATSEDRQQPVAKLRLAIKSLQKELRELDLTRGLLEWQIRQHRKREHPLQQQESDLQQPDEDDMSF